MSGLHITFDQPPSGKCPVQADGRINGHPFYFRSRGAHWALHINPRKEDPVDYCAWSLDPDRHWYHIEEYKGVMAFRDDEINDGKKFAAGWAEPDECLQFIERAAQIWLKEMAVVGEQQEGTSA